MAVFTDVWPFFIDLLINNLPTIYFERVNNKLLINSVDLQKILILQNDLVLF